MMGIFSNLVSEFRIHYRQDVPGLIDLMGGKDNFIRKLDENFDEGHYRHDNEPGHHYAYLYNYAGMHEKTQQRVRTIIQKNYRNTPHGLAGNDDAGQMASWYIMSALGFYPVTPASGEYALGVPYFEEATINLPGNKKLTIRAVGISDANTLMPVVRLNGSMLEKPFVRFSDLMQGGVLEFSPE